MKIAVLADPESAAGYRLAGLHVAIARDAPEAKTALAGMVKEREYVLIAVSQALLSDPYQAVKGEMEDRDLPILLAIPAPTISAADEGEDAREYVRRLVVATMGHEVKL